MLWEREKELAAIAHLLSHAAQGRGKALFFRSEPGLGKTQLLAHAAETARESFVVVRARGHELERSLPYALAQQVLESVLIGYGSDLEELSIVPDSLRLLLHRSLAPEKIMTDSGLTAKAELTHAFCWLLGSAAERRPLLLCLDDLHWGDPDSLDLFHFFLRRLGSSPVAIVGATRPWPPLGSQLADSLSLEAGTSIMKLQPLSQEASTALLQNRLKENPRPSAMEEAFALTKGNPFLLEELASFMETEATTSVGTSSLPSSRRSLILTRLRGLPQRSLLLLEAGSILGSSFSTGQAAELADMSQEHLEEALAPLLELDLLGPTSAGGLAFNHPLLRRAVYDSLPETSRRAWHRRAADLLKLQGARASILAPHLALGALPGDLNAVLLLWEAAAEAAAAGAYETAAIHLENALTLDPPGSVQARFLYDLGLAYLGAASPVRAVNAFARASNIADLKPATRYRIHRSWAYSLLVSGDLAAARCQVDLTIAEARDINPSLAAEISIGITVMQLMGDNMAESLASGLRAMDLAGKSGNSRLQATALAAWSHAAFDLGDPGACAAARDAAVAAPVGEDNEIEFLWGWTPQLNLGILASQTGRYEEGSAILQALVERGQAIHSLYEVFWASTFLAYLEHRRGRLRDAYRHSSAVAASYVSTLPWASTLGHAVHARILAEMGDLESAEASIVRVEAVTNERGMGLVAMVCIWTRAMVAMRRGQYAVAARLFLESEADNNAADRYGPGRFCWMADAPEAYLLGGLPEKARQLLADLKDASRCFDHPGLAAIAWRGLGMLEESEGHLQAAESAFAQALSLHRETDEALERARTLFAYGSYLRRIGRIKESRGVLDEAILIFRTCGSPLWQSQAETERRLAGGRRRSTRNNGSERLVTLTPQEYRIAELLAQGRSNREIAYALFISPKTLETHLRHIYRKLAISSRQDLRAYFTEEA